MSSTEDQPTQNGELGAMPTPEAEPGEPNPGGVDALPEEGENLVADLDPDDNPAFQDESSEEVKEAVTSGEDTQTEATKGSGDSGDEVDPKDETPA